jgi:hypothetical protein
LASLTVPLLLAAAAASAGAASAQQRFGVELRGGASVPLGALADGVVPDAGLAPGPSFAVHLHVPRRLRGAVLLGFAQHRFRCTGTACGDAGDLVTTGWSLATRVALRTGPSVPWIRLGVTFDRSEWDFPAPGADDRYASSLGLGGEAGVGYTFPIGDRSALNPGVRYGLVNTRFPRGERVLSQYLAVDLGVVVGF